jgi:hypothetical protein
MKYKQSVRQYCSCHELADFTQPAHGKNNFVSLIVYTASSQLMARTILSHWLFILHPASSWQEQYCLTDCLYFIQLAHGKNNIVSLIVYTSSSQLMTRTILSHWLFILHPASSWQEQYCLTVCLYFIQPAHDKNNIVSLIVYTSKQTVRQYCSCHELAGWSINNQWDNIVLVMSWLDEV